MPENESNANVALEEGAGPTPDASLASPEGSTAAKEGETTPAEKPPAEGKSSQEAPSPDESEDAKLPFNKHPRWVKIYGENKEMKGRLSALEEMGIKSKEDAELLSKDVDTAREKGVETGREELTAWIVQDPARFLENLLESYPKAADVLDRANASNILERVAAGYKESDPEFSEKLLGAANSLRGHGKNGRRAPESSETDALQTEKLSIQKERQAIHDEQAASEINNVFHAKIAELTKGIAFHSGKQQERFKYNIVQAAKEALSKNRIFNRQYERLNDVRGLYGKELQERRKEVVALHLKYAPDANLLNRLIEEEREVMGLKLQPKKPEEELHTEVTGSGTPIVGKLTQDAKTRKYNELRENYSGRALEMKYSEWLHAQ